MIGTKIEWATDTLNFWQGCSKVSPACQFCYAEAQDKRFHAAQSHWGDDAPRLIRKAAKWQAELDDILRRGSETGERPRVFVNSMSDFFEDRRDLDQVRLAALEAMRKAPEVDFLLLTKRPERIKQLLHEATQHAMAQVADMGLSESGSPLAQWLRDWMLGDAPRNIWIGATVENQEWADKRIPELLTVPAAVRFLSCEPLLGTVELARWIKLPRAVRGDWPVGHSSTAAPGLHRVTLNAHGARSVLAEDGKMLGVRPGECEDLGIGLDWVIVGGESGSHARPTLPDWTRSLREQCQAAEVPFFFKQWGALMSYREGGDGLLHPLWMQPGDGNFGVEIVEAADATGRAWDYALGQDMAFHRVGKRAAGRMLDGREWNEIPEVRR